jgi:chromosome segregation ATPase
MTDDPPKDLTDSEMLKLILQRLYRLEAAAEVRTKETRPKLDLIIKELSDIREDITEVKNRQARLERKFDILLDDSVDLRSQQKDFERRMWELERRPN